MTARLTSARHELRCWECRVTWTSWAQRLLGLKRGHTPKLPKRQAALVVQLRDAERERDEALEALEYGADTLHRAADALDAIAAIRTDVNAWVIGDLDDHDACIAIREKIRALDPPGETAHPDTVRDHSAPQTGWTQESP